MFAFTNCAIKLKIIMNNEFYKQLITQSPFGYAYHKIILDEDGLPSDYQFLEINPAFEKLTGLKREKVINKKITEVIPTIKKSEFNWINYYGEIALTGEERAFEQFSSELNCWYKVNAYSPEKYFFVTIFTDITSEKKQKEELERFFEINLDLLCIADTDGRFMRVNKSWERLLGYSTLDLSERNFLDFIHPEDVTETLLAISKLKSGEKILNFTNRYLNKNGYYRIIEWRSQLFEDLIYASARDVTEQYQIEKALAKSEAKFKSLFASMTEMVVLHEVVLNDDSEAVNYRIIDCNSAFSKITGLQKDDVVGKLATEVYAADKAPYLEEFCKVGISGKPYEFYTYYPAMDKHFMISVVSPEIGQFATITADITGIKQTEELIIAKNKELENYLYVASHDLRSPLVNIQGFSSRIKKQLDSLNLHIESLTIDEESKNKFSKIIFEGMPNSLSFIFTNVKKMDSLINGLLTISRTGRVKMSIQKIDMNDLIRKVLSSLNFQIEEEKALLNVSTLPPCFGDVNLINQLFSNLILNALKYRNPESSLIINIKGNRKNKRVIYSVEDNGIGIDEVNQKRIWEIFFRVNSQNDQLGEGIGLNLSAKIVEKHKGKIWVNSTLGKGSTFCVELLGSEFTE
jgi:PAS domain S-box-containing protein